jgi:hypothetical protein
MIAKAQAALLGGLVAAVLLGFGFFLTGFAWLVVGILVLGDHQPDFLSRNATATVLVTGLLASPLAASRLGWKVGRDWYRNGR